MELKNLATASVLNTGALYTSAITLGGHQLLADEPVEQGGTGLGPNPYELLLSSLGSCTSITLRMYAQRKQIPLASIKVELTIQKGEQATYIQRSIRLTGDLSAEQRERLLTIANLCPVHKILTGTMEITTQLL